MLAGGWRCAGGVGRSPGATTTNRAVPPAPRPAPVPRGLCDPGLMCAAEKCVKRRRLEARTAPGARLAPAAADRGHRTPRPGARAATPAARLAPSRPIPPRSARACRSTARASTSARPSTSALEFGTVAKCTERLKLSCVDAVMAPGSGLTAAAMAACTAALATASCDDLFNRNDPRLQLQGHADQRDGLRGQRAMHQRPLREDRHRLRRCARTTWPTAASAQSTRTAPPAGCATRAIAAWSPRAAGAACSDRPALRLRLLLRRGTCRAGAAMAGAGLRRAPAARCRTRLYCGGRRPPAPAIPFGAPGAACGDSATIRPSCAGRHLHPRRRRRHAAPASPFAADGEACGAPADNELRLPGPRPVHRRPLQVAPAAPTCN